LAPAHLQSCLERGTWSGTPTATEIDVIDVSASPFCAPTERRPESRGRAAPGTLVILVVDEDASTRNAIANAVHELGHECLCAADGDDAWTLLQKHPMDVVISDWQMPGLSGPELCRRTRVASEEGRYTYFVLMTILHDREHLLAGMAAGADDFQRKPVDFDELEARLISASRVVALHRRLAAQTEGLRRETRAFYAESRTDALTLV